MVAVKFGQPYTMSAYVRRNEKYVYSSEQFRQLTDFHETLNIRRQDILTFVVYLIHQDKSQDA
jgi:hypothetical protein